MIVHALTVYSDSGHLTDAVIDACILGGLILLDTGGAAFMIRSQKPTLTRGFYFILGNSFAALLILTAYKFINDKLLNSNDNLIEASGLQEGVIMVLCFVTLVCIGLFNWLLVIIEDRDEAKMRRLDEKDLLRQSELNDLRQQLQPHFLFNSLNSIQSLMLFDSKKASQMITMLADFLRGSIQKDTSQLRSLEEELKHLKLYLAIEAIRFEERLIINLEVSETIQNAQLPALILQPLVENAIKYGLYGVVGNIELKIKIELNASFLIIQIVNPYDESSSKTRNGTGFGLSSVSRRLNLIYFRNDLLQIKNENSLFHVTLRIPQLNDTSNHN